MRSSMSLLAMLFLISVLMTGCGCLAADSHDKSECRKYHTEWGHSHGD